MFQRSVRASRLERTRALPGNELIPEAIATLTHAVTIHCPSQTVWPWLVQMGAGNRAGWYSYDFLDNGRRHSADRIVPGLQAIEIGALFPAVPGATDGFHLLAFEPGHYLVLGWRPTPGVAPIMTWAFVLEDCSDGNTRLIVRARGGQQYPFYGLPRWIGARLIRLAHFIMERKQLLGIASRAESQPATDNRSIRTDAA